MSQPTYLTKEGKEKLEEELHYLKTVRRDEVAAAIQSAKEEGDLSENSAYDEAKLAQGFLEGRIQTIEAQLQEAKIIATDNTSDVISLGSRVTVIEVGESDEECYQIVGSAEADPMEGKISNESPIGSALIGKKVGDKVTAETPGGSLELEIVKLG